MKQIILPILGTILFIILVGLFIQGKLTKNPNSNSNLPTHYLTIDKTKIQVEISDTNSKREKGLSGRSSLDEGKGMLFIFPQKEVTARFWMKDMLIPIDIIWIKNGKIIQIDKNAQPPVKGTPDNKLQLYTTKEPVNYVLEVPAGYSDKSGFSAGDGIDLSSL
jgi:uncharacterized membrane protein (UPF0127 family)